MGTLIETNFFSKFFIPAAAILVIRALDDILYISVWREGFN